MFNFLKQVSQKDLHLEPLKIAFKKGNNICCETLVLTFKPLYLQNFVLSDIGNNSVHFILQLVPK